MRLDSWRLALLLCAFAIAGCAASYERSAAPAADGSVPPSPDCIECTSDGGRAGSGAGTAGASTGGPSRPYPSTGMLSITFSPMYSAFIDDEHPCRIPAFVTNWHPVEWSASDDSYVRLEPIAENGGVMITTLRPGMVEIIARAGALESAATLHISAFTAAEWEAGRRRYHNGVEYREPTQDDIIGAGLDMDAGVDPMEPWRLPRPTPNAACDNCHGDEAPVLWAPDTPQQIGGFTDLEVEAIITHGIRPASALPFAVFPAQIFQPFHQWDAADPGDETQRNGIIAYLRTLTPKPRDAHRAQAN